MSFLGKPAPWPRSASVRVVRPVQLPLVAALAVATVASASHRYVRRFDETSGLTVATVTALAQDRSGFLWLGTHGGLLRFDGHTFERWARTEVPGTVRQIVAQPGDGVFVLLPGGILLKTTARGVEVVPVPGAARPEEVTDVACDGDGRLWVVLDGRVWVRSDGWRQLDPAAAGPSPARYVRRVGRLIAVLTRDDVRLVDASRRLLQVIPVGGAADIVRRADGGLVLLRLQGQVLAAGKPDADFRKVMDLPARGVALAARGDAVWAAFDRFLARIGPGGASEVMGLAEGIPSGGRLLVDREGSLWMGTFAGLLQFPEPDTTIWTDLEGLPSAHARYVAWAGDGVLVSTWQGLGRVRDDGRGKRALVEPLSTTGPLCADGEGAVWLAAGRGLYRYREGRARLMRPGPMELRDCSVGPDGLWLAGDTGLLLVRNGTSPVPAGRPENSAPVDAVLETDRRELIWVSGTRVCRQPVEAALTGGGGGLRCWEQPDISQASDLAQVEDEVWLAGRGCGLLRLHGNRAVPHPLAAALPSRVVFSVSASPAGGVWLAGKGFVIRVVPDQDRPEGWRVAERLGPWQGLPGRSGGQVLERPDGSLWIPTDNGLVHIRASARAEPAGPPTVVISEILKNGAPWAGGPLELPWGRRHLELRFAALSYRDPARLRYRSRVDGGAWSPPGTNPQLSLSALAPGRHRVAIQASVDGVRWSPEAARFAFKVIPPWWRTWWALALAAGLLTFALALTRRIQLATIRRVERERERIAADLHDQVGSGLASIGILASLMGGELPSQRRAGLAMDIADTSARLSFTLRAIVWSLRQPDAGLRDTVAQLADHGAKLLGGCDGILEVDLPQRWPAGLLPLSLRRNLLLIGLEALHNAARHAHAGRVRLSVAPVESGLWRLTIADDGVGFEPGDGRERRSGLGLLTMRRRAEAMEGRLEIDSEPGGGTAVTLVFDPTRPVPGKRTVWHRMKM